MTHRTAKLAAALVVLASAWLSVPLGHATTMTKPLTLADLVQHSSQIVAGTVKAVHEGRLGNLPYTDIEVQVGEVLQGPAAETVTLRQIGITTALAPANGRRYVGILPGMPRYAQGEQVLLFLGKTSPEGFRTTVGLQQGKFNLVAGGVVNGLDNRGLFRDVIPRARLSDAETAVLSTTEGAADATTFKTVVRRAIAERWWNSPPSSNKPTRRPEKLGRVGVQ